VNQGATPADTMDTLIESVRSTIESFSNAPITWTYDDKVNLFKNDFAHMFTSYGVTPQDVSDYMATQGSTLIKDVWRKHPDVFEAMIEAELSWSTYHAYGGSPTTVPGVRLHILAEDGVTSLEAVEFEFVSNAATLQALTEVPVDATRMTTVQPPITYQGQAPADIGDIIVEGTDSSGEYHPGLYVKQMPDGSFKIQHIAKVLEYNGNSYLVPAGATSADELTIFPAYPGMVKVEDEGAFFAKRLSTDVYKFTLYSALPNGTSELLSLPLMMKDPSDKSKGYAFISAAAGTTVDLNETFTLAELSNHLCTV
jgi:hypothetical protein